MYVFILTWEVLVTSATSTCCQKSMVATFRWLSKSCQFNFVTFNPINILYGLPIGVQSHSQRVSIMIVRFSFKPKSLFLSIYIMKKYACMFIHLFIIDIMDKQTGQLLNWVQQKSSFLIGQLSTAYICDWLTKVKQIYASSFFI